MHSAAGQGPIEGVLLRAMPWVFVLIWSTGFIMARHGMPHAPPMSFLAWRYALSVLAFGLWVGWSRPSWPVGRNQWLHLAASGVLMHAGYLGGVWSAVKLGMGAGTVALIVGLQPVLTAFWLQSRGGKDRIGARQWAGLGLGLLGLTLVLWRKLGQGELSALNLTLGLGALVCITVGTLYQKHFLKPCDVRSANLVQLLAALAVTAPLAMLESEPVRWVPELIGALAWSVLALTLGGSSLLYLLIQRGAASRVSSLMYLVPPCTAVMAWALFGETLSGLTLVGIGVTVAGVALVVRSGSPAGDSR
jgi:drug/metabolite transporter (DMT)-like permease